jgi:hypothetical protein
MVSIAKRTVVGITHIIGVAIMTLIAIIPLMVAFNIAY